jgi:hypothetical protein
VPGNGPGFVPSPTGFFSLLGGKRASSVLTELASGVLARYYPFTIPRQVSLTELGGDCYTNAAGVTKKLAIFAANATTNAVGAVQDYAEISMAGTQWRSAAFQNGTLILPAGNYWLGTFNSATTATGLRVFLKEYAMSIGQNAPSGGSQEARMVNLASSTPTSYATWPATTNAITYTEDNTGIPWIVATQA